MTHRVVGFDGREVFEGLSVAECVRWWRDHGDPEDRLGGTMGVLMAECAETFPEPP